MRRLLVALLAATALTAAPAVAASAASADRDGAADRQAARRIHLAKWDAPRQLRRGRLQGLDLQEGRLVFAGGIARREWAGRTYDVARWSSPWVQPGFSFTQLIASWSAATPADSWVEVKVRGRSAAGRASWDTLARWAAGDQHVDRHSGEEQADDRARVDVDTWTTAGLTGYQVRVQLHRRAGTRARPSVDLVAAMTSRLPATAGPTSSPGVARGTVLPVPRYSQMVHRGHYPQWGSGGQAWCSPTSTSMVLGYYDALPRPRRYAWVPDGHVDPWVDHAARMTYDHAYDGTGNWPFNTAYAAPLAGKAYVTRLPSLRAAERYVADGVPLVVSVAFGRGELDGAPISSTNGHLLVIVGFRQNGDVVVNDPAAQTRRGVRRTYDRGQLERLWLEASGGLTYVITRGAHG